MFELFTSTLGEILYNKLLAWTKQSDSIEPTVKILLFVITANKIQQDLSKIMVV